MQQLEQERDRLDSPTPQSLTKRTRWSITDLTVSIAPSSSSSSRPTSSSTPPSTSRPRWRTNEFYLYYVVFLVVVPQMYLSAVRASSGQFPFPFAPRRDCLHLSLRAHRRPTSR